MHQQQWRVRILDMGQWALLPPTITMATIELVLTEFQVPKEKADVAGAIKTQPITDATLRDDRSESISVGDHPIGHEAP